MDSAKQLSAFMKSKEKVHQPMTEDVGIPVEKKAEYNKELGSGKERTKNIKKVVGGSKIMRRKKIIKKK